METLIDVHDRRLGPFFVYWLVNRLRCVPTAVTDRVGKRALQWGDARTGIGSFKKYGMEDASMPAD